MDGVPSDILRCMAALKVLEEKIGDLRAVIASRLDLYHSMPEGENKDQLLIEIGSLDAIADTMQQAFDSMKEE